MPDPELSDLPDIEMPADALQRSDIDQLKTIVTKHFKVYDIRWNEKSAVFYFNFNQYEFEKTFEAIRVRLKKDGFIPKVNKEHGESLLYIVRSPKVKPRNIWVNISLIILTIITTTWAGSILWYGRLNIADNSEIYLQPLFNLECVLFGFLSFSLPLMLILGTHESAHYLAAKRHNIDASLPYFIPLPPPFMLGTMGAFISMREPISNKKALLDIGAAGPIAGFLVTIPVLIIGFTLEGLNPVSIGELPSNVYIFNEPLLFAGLRGFFPTTAENSLIHPTAFAGWVGLFVTGLNLIPGGQLDGGHIARALLGKYAKTLSIIVIIFLIVLAFITEFWVWIFFAFIIMFLGMSHPPPLNDISPLGIKRKAIGAFCVVMLLLCIHYSPIAFMEITDHELEFECDNNNQVVYFNSTAIYYVNITNLGEETGDIEFTYDTNSVNTNLTDWNTSIQLRNSKNSLIRNWNGFELRPEKHFMVVLSVTPGENINLGGKIIHELTVNISGFRTTTGTYTLSTHIGTFELNTSQPDRQVVPGNDGKFNIHVKNLIDNNDVIDLILNYTPPDDTGHWGAIFNNTIITLGPYEEKIFQIEIATPFNGRPGKIIEFELVGRSRLNPKAQDRLKLSLELL